jgi:two-component system, chemotaxis family, CheB/CheR fusion protein
MADGTFGLDSVVDSRAKQTMVWGSPDAYASDAANRPSARPPQTAGAWRAGASFPMTQGPLSVVGIGASAGGIEAFRRFFERMPVDSGLAFIIVLHLPAGRKSMLAEILARWTTMKVTEARDGDAITANHVLVIPAGAVARLQDGILSLRHLTAEPPQATAAPIDVFFDSMAAALDEDAIGVILSGTGHDGTLGLKAIKARGGFTLAQGRNGTAPEYRDMPDSAVAAGAVDLYVPVEEMSGHILTERQVRAASAGEAGQPEIDVDKIRLAICDLLRSRLGHDFSQYKRQTFMRRVRRRMQVLRLSGYEGFLARLESDREQVVLLFRDLLISVTSFFRDPDAFATLESDVIPLLFRGKDAAAEVRVWVPGCATGEEAYSLAILLREHMDTLPTVPKVQIFASDIDEVAIVTARAGRYPSTLLDNISPARRSRFFTGDVDGYVVRQQIRELCTFSAHNLARDPPFSQIDLISCRNLLIYMDNDLQDRIIPIFHYALLPHGILVLGSSETIARHERLLLPLDRSQRIFVRQDAPSELPIVYPIAAGDARRGGAGMGAANRADPKAHWPRAVAFACRRVLERFASPFVVVSATGEVVHFSSHTGRFLEPAQGSPTTSLFEMARRGWGPELRSALRRCVETNRPVEQQRPVVAADGGQAPPVRLIVERLPGSATDPLYMIVFAEVEPSRSSEDRTNTAALPEMNPPLAQLELEKRELREQLQSIAEEHVTAVEELRSSNEELQSVNDELQSTNEELETSREEIQAINEELNTVNVQLTAKVELLDRSNGDLKNLFDSTKVATAFLDPFRIIRSFTPEIANIYNLIPSDIGRPLSDIVSRLTYATLREDVQAVLQTLQPMERRVERQDGSAHYMMRILPYRSPDSRIDGSLITFVDVTSIVRAEQHQRLLVDELNHRVKNMLTVVISLATNTFRRASALESFQEVFLGRIHALTAAYALLSRDGWSSIPAREVLTEELKPFMTGERTNIVLTGPPVLLQPRAALALGMAMHELTTNAVKYGALSVPDGTVEVSWGIDSTANPERLVLKWVERNGPPVVAPERRGFGMTLIERGFAHDVGGEVEVEFAAEGVVATLRAPLLGQTHKAS